MAIASHDDPTRHDGQVHHEDRSRQYVFIAVILAVLTAIEVATTEVPMPKQAIFALLMGLMVVKFVMVTMYFMHLKFDKKFLTVAFYSGLVLAVLVYIAVLTAFRFWWPSSHMVPGLIQVLH